jgi:CDP-glucose 4,6-dehydratase
MTELKNCWDEVNWEAMPDPNAPHEANFLYLDSSKARRIIGWQPQWNLRRALTETAYWYQRVIADPSTAREACEHQLAIFEQGL